jgi:glucose-6-phosphate isomerase
MQLSIDKTLVKDLMVENHYNSYKQMGSQVIQALKNNTCEGNDFLGWMNLPSKISNEELNQIQEVADKLRSNSDVVVVIGIGGSYLGARAVIESQLNPFANKGTEIVYAGHHLSPGYLTELASHLEGKKWSVVAISKSGTTTEPAVAFRFLRQKLTEQFGENSTQDRIVAITDEKKGALRQLVESEGLPSFIIPDNVGGRFSVFTPVGLLPIAIAGFDIKALIKGAVEMEDNVWSDNEENLALEYAAIRNALNQNGYGIEVLANYHHKFHYISEWWKQLYGESEGKDGKGIFPASVDLTTDLHSMGQYLQDGKRNIFETVIEFEKTKLKAETIQDDSENLDKLNYLAGNDLSYVNAKALEGTMLAHRTGGVPNIKISIANDDMKSIGSLLQFFMAACGISGLMLQVNPFNQPGVEDYKRNMFALLQKPGFEKEGEELQKLKKNLGL